MREAVSVAVVIPAKDRSHVIGRALRSVLAQTVRPLEIIVVDDGSQDDTAALATSRGASVLTHSEPRGSGIARNTGITAATADWIAFLDSDDEWFPQHLERVWAAADGHVLVAGAAVDSTGRGWGNVSGRPLVLTPRRCLVPENPIVTSAVLVKRQALLDAGLFGAFPRAQDVHMWARVLELGPGIALPEPTAVYHLQSGPVEPSSVVRDRTGLDQVLASFEGRPWMDPGVRRATETRQRWDDARRALHERDIGPMRQAGAWMLRRPATWRDLYRLVSFRRGARRKVWAGVLRDHLAS